MILTEIKTHFIQINLSDLIQMIGEEKARAILSNFSCPKNKDVEKFLRCKAIEFSKRNFAKTHLVFWETSDKTEKELVGYYTIASKWITVARDVINTKEAKKLREHGICNREDNAYTTAAPLIAQLGKNYIDANDALISGAELLTLAMEKIKLVQNEVGGRFAYLECEDKPKLLEFYQRNNFKIFGKRRLDRDETDMDGEYLVQLFTMIT
jgi:hypothetical protein